MLEIVPFMPVSDTLFVADTESSKKVLFPADLSEKLRVEAVEALRSLPKRGLEIGGLLLGSTNGSLVIQDLAPVESEHLYGPRYELSEKDRATFQAKVEELWHSPAGESVPIGLFRTYTLGEAATDLRDQEALRQYFPQSDAVLILAGPKLTGRTTVSCFYWDQQNLIPCTAKIQSIVPAEQSESQKPEPVTASPEAASSLWQPPAIPAQVRKEQPDHASPPKFSKLSEAVIAAVAALIVFIAVSLLHHEPASAVVAPAKATGISPLETKLVSTSTGVELIWNRGSDVVRHALGALLSVRAEGTTTDLPITLSELESGSVFFGSAKPKASFVFTVYAADGSQTQEKLISETISAAATKLPAKAAHTPAPQKTHKGTRGRNKDHAQMLVLPPPVTVGSGSIFGRP